MSLKANVGSRSGLPRAAFQSFTMNLWTQDRQPVDLDLAI